MTEDLTWLGSWLVAESVNGYANANSLQDHGISAGQGRTGLDVDRQLFISSDTEKPLGPHTISAPLTRSQSTKLSGAFNMDQSLNQMSTSPQVSSLAYPADGPIRSRPRSYDISLSPSTTSTARSGLPSIETSMYISRSASLDTAISITPSGGHSPSKEISSKTGHSNANVSFFSSWKKPSTSGAPNFSNTRTRSSSSPEDCPQLAQYQLSDAAHERPSSHQMITLNAKIDPDKLQRRRTMARALLGPSNINQVRSSEYEGSQNRSSRYSVSSSSSSHQIATSRESVNLEQSGWLGFRSAQEIAVSPSSMASSFPSEGLHEGPGAWQQTVPPPGRRPVSKSFSGPTPAGLSQLGSSYSGRNVDGHYTSFLEKGPIEGETRRRVMIDGRLFEFEGDGRSLKLVENESQDQEVFYGSPTLQGSSLSSPLSLQTRIYLSNNQTLSPHLPASASSFYGDVYSIRGSIASSISGGVPDTISPVLSLEKKSLGIDWAVEQGIVNRDDILEGIQIPSGKERSSSIFKDSFRPLSLADAATNRLSPNGPNQPRIVNSSEESFEEPNPSTPQKVQSGNNNTALSYELENPSGNNPSGSPYSTVSTNLPTPPMLDESALHEMKSYNSSTDPDQPSPSPSSLVLQSRHQHQSSHSSSKSWSSKKLPSKLIIPPLETLSSRPADKSTREVSDDKVQANHESVIRSEKGRERGVVVEEQYDSGEEDGPLILQTQSRQPRQHRLLQSQQSPQHPQQIQRAKSKNLPLPPLISPLYLSEYQSTEEPRYESGHTRSESAPADPYEVLSRPMPKEYDTQDIWKKGVKKLGVIGALGKAATRKGTRYDRPPPTGPLRNLTPTTPVYPKHSPGQSHFLSAHRIGHEYSDAGGVSANDLFGSSHAGHMEHLRRIHQEPLREAVSPTVHTGGQIAARANAIENEDERKLAENMFM